MSRLILYRLATIAVILPCACRMLSAQPASVGTELSPFRVGAVYRHASDRFVHSITLGADLAGPLLKRCPVIGFYTDYSCTLPVASAPLRETVFSFHAGPGISIAMADDFNHPVGVVLGPMADLRAEFESRKQPIVLSIMLKPQLAFHTYRDVTTENLCMSIYKQGLLNSLIPQFGIAYRFDGRNVTPAEERETSSFRQKRITFGVEAEYIANIHTYSHFNYVTEEGYRVNLEDTQLRYNTNAQVLAGIGVNMGRHFNLSLYTGYQGICQKQALIPLLLRPRILFGEPGDNGRWMLFVDSGPGFKASRNVDRVAVISHIGTGYRLAVTKKTSLDIIGGIHSTVWHPWFFDETIADVRRNNEALLGINLGVAVIL